MSAPELPQEQNASLSENAATGETLLPEHRSSSSSFRRWWNKFRRPVKIMLWIFVTYLVLRVFFFQVARIHTPSMHQTLIEGDYVLVNKFAYGARIPMTPFYVNWIQLPYWRMP